MSAFSEPVSIEEIEQEIGLDLRSAHEAEIAAPVESVKRCRKEVLAEFRTDHAGPSAHDDDPSAEERGVQRIFALEKALGRNRKNRWGIIRPRRMRRRTRVIDPARLKPDPLIQRCAETEGKLPRERGLVGSAGGEFPDHVTVVVDKGDDADVVGGLAEQIDWGKDSFEGHPGGLSVLAARREHDNASRCAETTDGLREGRIHRGIGPWGVENHVVGDRAHPGRP